MYELNHPWALSLCIMPALVYYGLSALTVEYKLALKIPFFTQWQQTHLDGKLGSQQCLWFFHWVVIWCLLVLALAGPRWVGEPQSLKYESHNVMMVLDISGSMGLEDMPSQHHHLTTRWSVVKKTALDFVTHRTEDKMGVVLFGERAYMFAPLTYDQTTLKQRIEDASVGLAGQATALGDAMGVAIKHLQNMPSKGRIMILLTDGVANAGVVPPLKAAELAKQEGIKIYSIGLGPDENTKNLPNIFWQMQHVNDLDEKTLKEISQITGGKYYRAMDEKSLSDIYADIQKLEPVAQSRQDLRPEKQYFFWPLGLAFVWMMALFGQQMYRDWRFVS